MTTITLMFATLTVVAMVMLLLDRIDRRSRRRDRAIMRRLHTYMAQLPPARPW